MTSDEQSAPVERGRPSKYDPAFCAKVIEWGRQGKSRAWIAAELEVVRQTLKNWEEEFPEFLVAMERAKLLEQQWWEDEGQSALRLQGYQASIWSRSMAARFPDDWREKQDVDLNARVSVTEIKRTIVDPRNSDA